MDKGLKHEKLLKTEQEKHLALRQGVVANQWDSVESDTESLAQEKAYQQQLKMCIGHNDQNKYILPQKENVDTLYHGDGEDEDVNDDETDPQVYDSLEVTAHPHDKRNPTLLQTEYLDTQIDKSKGTRQLLSDDAYSDLRYDPNWRINLKGAGRFTESPPMSMEEYYHPKEKASQSCGDRQGLIIKGGLRYILNTSPAVIITPHSASNESDQPDHLHAQHGQTSSVKSPHCHNYALQVRSPETDLSRPSSIFTQNETDSTSQRGFREKYDNSCDHGGNTICRSPELTEDIHPMYIQESKTYYQQDQRRTQGEPTQTQQMSSSTLTTPKVLSNRKLQRFKEDIVQRNKITLGRNTPKCGSYVMMHGPKQSIPHNVTKVHETFKEEASTESQANSSDPKQRWLQKTPQLRVTQISKGKKTQQKDYLNPPHQQQTPPVLGVRAERGDCLTSQLARPATETQPKPQNTTSLQPIPPTIHLNINLNTSSHLLPLLQQKGQDAIINLASLHGFPHWSFAPEGELGLSPGHQQTNPGKSSQMSWKGLHHRNLERSPEQWQRTAALKWPLSCEGEVQKWNPNEIHTKQFPQNLLRSPTTTSPLGSGSYTVLPSIGQPMTGNEPEQSPGQSVSTAIHRSGSDGYLVQMEKQKQLRARVTYKAYSLKDYKQLKSDINLQGLGPDYTAIEKTAEKMKQQRLYSNVIREQNKKISRIPFLPAKDPEGTDKKVPRMKALEYAKTIAKPPVQSQPKRRQKHQSEGFTERTPYMEDLDGTQLATLEVLRRRHEEEKQAVALFRKVYAI